MGCVQVKPVVRLETGRSIAAIVWRKLRPDEVIVSFSFISQLRLYDLSEVQDATSSPSRLLEVSGMSKEGGHRVLTLFTAPLQKATSVIGRSKARTTSLEMGEFLLAGSELGYLRCWHLHRPSSRTEWNLLADPKRSATTAEPIVAILVRTERWIVAVTAEAVLCTYDLHHLQPPAFGSGGHEPTLVSRFAVDLPSHARLAQVQLLDDTMAILLLTNGEIMKVDVVRNVSLLSISPPSWTCSLGTSVTSRVGGGDEAVLSLEELRDFNRSRSTNASIKCPPVCAVWKQSLCSPLIAVFQSSRLRLVSCGSKETNGFTSLGSQSYYHHRLRPVVQNLMTGEWESSLRRTNTFSLTLKTVIVEAERGDCNVRVNEDLTAMLGSEWATASSLSRCHLLRFEWQDGEGIHHFDASVASVRLGTVTLTAPYMGPYVENGSPRVRLRTQLAPSSWALGASYFVNPSSSREVKEPPELTTLSGRELTEITAFAMAPTWSLAIAGDSEERLWAIPFEGPDLEEVRQEEVLIGEEMESSGEGVISAEPPAMSTTLLLPPLPPSSQPKPIESSSPTMHLLIPPIAPSPPTPSPENVDNDASRPSLLSEQEGIPELSSETYHRVGMQEVEEEQEKLGLVDSLRAEPSVQTVDGNSRVTCLEEIKPAKRQKGDGRHSAPLPVSLISSSHSLHSVLAPTSTSVRSGSLQRKKSQAEVVPFGSLFVSSSSSSSSSTAGKSTKPAKNIPTKRQINDSLNLEIWREVNVLPLRGFNDEMWDRHG
eukprot:scaffold978_cov172-Ochromonas_danica.AAC.9